MSFFDKPLNELTSEDIVAFCNKAIKENIILDYKADFPSELAKVISAFANTYGGLIIIGVKEDDGFPLAPFIGIPYTKGLEERVLNICVDSIFPPVIPFIRVCKSEDEQNAFVVIQVPESDTTPHTIESNTRAYVRTGNISKPEDSMSFDRIEWLLQKRKKSTELREELHKSAIAHVSNIVQYRQSAFVNGILSIFIAPLFPRDPIFPSLDFLSVIERSRLKSNRGWSFPPGDSPNPIKDGMYSFHYVDRSLFSSYFEMTRFGSIFSKINLCTSFAHNPTKPPRTIYLRTIDDYIYLSLSFAEKVYTEANYLGSIYYGIQLDKLLGTIFIQNENFVPENQYILDDRLTFIRTIPLVELYDKEKKRQITDSLCEEITWAFGESSYPF